MATKSGTEGTLGADLSRREQLLFGARDLFLHFGYKKTTLEDIGRACGLGKAAAYHYFPGGKQGIFEEVVRYESTRMLGEIRAAVALVEDPREQLAAVMETRFRLLGDYLSDSGVAAEMAEILPQAEAVREEYFQQEADIIRGVLLRGHDLGLFRDIGDDAPTLLISAVRGVEAHFARNHASAGIDAGISLLLDLLLQGLCRR